MPSSFFKNVSAIASIFIALAGAVFLWMGRPAGALGVLVGGAWIFLNSYFLFQILEIGMAADRKPKDRILLLTVIKFPVLYLAGYFILKSHAFPVSGILAGLTAFMASFLFQWMRANVAAAAQRQAS